MRIVVLLLLVAFGSIDICSLRAPDRDFSTIRKQLRWCHRVADADAPSGPVSPVPGICGCVLCCTAELD